MTTSPTAEDLYKYIGMAFEKAQSDPKLVEKLSGTGGVLKVLVTEPDGCMIIDLSRASAVPGTAGDPADATLRMTGDMANRFWQGDLNLLLAVTRGDIVLEGKMALIAKAVPAARELFPIYIELLKNDGRTDLLA